MSFEKRVVLVTGAGRGIGRAIAAAFAREKAHVVLNDVIPTEDLEKVAGHIAFSGVPILAIQADVGRSDQVREMMGRIEEHFQRLDILVNNAGIIRRGTIETVTEEDWDRVIGVNLKGTFNCCRFAVDMLKRQSMGKIINVSSVAGKMGDITSARGMDLQRRLLTPSPRHWRGSWPNSASTSMPWRWTDE